MNESGQEIQLRKIFQSLFRKWWIIVMITALIGGGGAYLLGGNTGEPISTAKASVIVNEGEDVNFNMKTLTAMMNEPAVLEQVASKLPWETSVTILNQNIAAEEIEGSQIIRVTANGRSPEEATELVNTVVETFPEIAGEKANTPTVTVLSEAKVEEAGIYVTDNSQTMKLISIAAGLAAGIGAALLIDGMDRRIRTEREVELILESPVMGATSKINRLAMRPKKVKKKAAVVKEGENVV
ncbi:YveK family protein [Bacillus daqingensis]|uniref:YveK family protein n=1 Tax=Bacillus daqingensis TaxID=872396 RepID=A0ABV9NV26_9BACI